MPRNRPGDGGASLAKRHWGETIDNVAGPSEDHWMARNHEGGHTDTPDGPGFLEFAQGHFQR